jgi:hypothetical protein
MCVYLTDSKSWLAPLLFTFILIHYKFLAIKPSLVMHLPQGFGSALMKRVAYALIGHTMQEGLFRVPQMVRFNPLKQPIRLAIWCRFPYIV